MIASPMLRLLPTLLLLVSLTACDAARFSTARRQDTIEAYRKFLAVRPNSDHTKAASQRLEALEYRRARTADKVIGYRMFLDAYPGGRYAADCRARLAGKAMASAKTPADLQLILELFPDTEEAATARERLPGALAARVLMGGDDGAMASFLERFPGHASGEKIRAALATARWTKLGKDDRLVLESFARRMAGTPEAREARKLARTMLENEVAARGTLALLRELQSRYPRSPRLAELSALVSQRTAALAMTEMNLMVLKKKPAIRLGGVEISAVIKQCGSRPETCQTLADLARAARPWRPVGMASTMRAAVYGEDLLGAWRGVEALGWAADEASANLLLELAGTTRISMVRLASRSLARWLSRGTGGSSQRWLKTRLRTAAAPNRVNPDDIQRHGLLRLLAGNAKERGQGTVTLRKLMATPDRALSAGFLLATNAGGSGGLPLDQLQQLTRAAESRLKALEDGFPAALNKESAVAATLAERELFSLTRALAEASASMAGNSSPLALLQARAADTLARWQVHLAAELEGFIPATDPDLSAKVKTHRKGRASALITLRRRRDPAGRATAAALCMLQPSPACSGK